MNRHTPCPWYPLLLFVILILLATPAFALPTISISSPESDGVFVLRGAQMDGVSGLDLSIGYDSGTLGNPRVTMGRMLQGMMSAANPGNPIRMAIVGTRALTGGGIIATITFDRTGSSPGVITSLTGTLIDVSGKRVAMAQPVVANPSAATAAGGSQEDAARAGEGATAGGTSGATPPITIVVPGPAVVGGTVTMPGQETAPGLETSAGRDSKAAGELTPAQEAAPVAKKRPGTRKAQMEGEEPLDREENPPPPEEERTQAPDTAAQQVSQPVKIASVLTRFKEFQGERTAASLVALFRQDPGLPYTQVPPVALADGKATVTLVIAVKTGEATPRFTFSGCSYVSHNRNETGAWEIQARPERGAVKAGVTMLYGGLSQEFPLTVAPKVQLVQGKARPVKEADFGAFLRDRGTPARPRFDLNKDGRRDYVDDYIFTANYLAQVGQQAR